MRFRSILLLALPGLAAACQPALEAGPRVQFVANSRLTTTARLLTTPADTVTTRIYAQADDSPLQRLLITVTYEPVPEPVLYSEFQSELPKADLVYLDSTGFSLDTLAFQSTQPTRSTAGLETWRYEAFDAKDRKGTRSLRLRLPRADSLAVYHNYTVTLTASVTPAIPQTATTKATPAINTGRRFLALREGLALPVFSVRNLPANQLLIDLIYQFDQTTSTASLSLPTDETLKLNWARRRATEIRSVNLGTVALDSTAFLNASTTVLLRAAFNSGTAFVRPGNTGPLRRGQLLAFLTPEDKVGLLRVQRLSTTNQRMMVVQVRVSK